MPIEVATAVHVTTNRGPLTFRGHGAVNVGELLLAKIQPHPSDAPVTPPDDTWTVRRGSIYVFCWKVATVVEARADAFSFETGGAYAVGIFCRITGHDPMQPIITPRTLSA